MTMRAFGWMLLAACTAASAPAHVGTGLDADSHGNLCLSDTIHNRIVRVLPTGAWEVVATGVHTNAVACGEDGSVYFADGDSVWVRTPRGTRRKLFKASILRPGLGEPFAIDPSGNSYFAAGSEIVRMSPRGEAVMWRRLGTARPISGGVLENDVLYVKIGESIARVGADGALQRIAEGKAAGAGGLVESELWRRRTLGIAASASGSVYVANHRYGRVEKIAPSGATTILFRSSFPWTPVGVATRGSDVYILERPGRPYGATFVLGAKVGRHRLWRIRDGNARLVSTIGKPSLASRAKESGVAICVHLKQTAAAYLVRLLRWSIA